MKTIVFAINLDSIANMPCNPSVGGTAKGHLVRELDALGGEMGKCTDKTLIQSKILNSAKGPAVYSLRAQVDRRRYQMEMKNTLENQENLYIKQAEIIELLTDENNCVAGVKTHTGAIYHCRAAILTTGTYLRGKIIPVMDMRLRFAKQSVEYTDRTCIIVVQVMELSVGLIVDHVAEVLVIAEDNIVPPPELSRGNENKYIKAIGKANSDVKLILDSEKLIMDKDVDTISQIA
jgi:hypothetical protein